MRTTEFNQKQLIEAIEDGSNLVAKHLDLKNLSVAANKSELFEELRSLAYDENVIGYLRAKRFLQENDPSLTISISIADCLEIPVKEIDTELLATLLLQNLLQEEIYNLEQIL